MLITIIALTIRVSFRGAGGLPPQLGNSHHSYAQCTVFIRIVTVATINFSPAWVRPLIEGGSYSRAAFFNFGPMLDSVIHTKS